MSRGDLREALVAAGAGVGGSIALATASIAAGFYAFLPTDYTGVSELGLIAGTGMLVAFVLSLTLLPALLQPAAPPRRGRGDRLSLAGAARSIPDSAPSAGADLRRDSGGRYSLSLLPRLSFDFNPLNLRSPKTESVATILDLMKDRSTSPYTIEVLAPSLAEAQKEAERLSKLPEIAQVITLASFVPKDQDAKLALIQDAAMLIGPTLEPDEIKPPPTDQEVVASLKHAAAALKAAAAGTGPSGAACEAPCQAGECAGRRPAAAPRGSRSPDHSRAEGDIEAARPTRCRRKPITLKTLPPELVRDWIAADGRARIEVFPKGDPNDNEAMRQFAEAVLKVAPEATGAPISVQETSRTVVNAFMEAGVLAFLAITLMLAFVLRRFHDVIVTLLPLLLSGLATLSISVAIGLPLNFANIIALPLLFGIGVAFNIYFVMAWRNGTGDLLSSSLTRAILYSALTTGTAFGSLCLSKHPGTASMGNLLALSLGCTLVATLLFLPALLGPAEDGAIRPARGPSAPAPTSACRSFPSPPEAGEGENAQRWGG